MSTDTEAPIYKKSALEFKSSSFSVPVLVIHSAELTQIKHQLKEKIAQAPEFFRNSPLLIDLQHCNEAEQAFELAALIGFLRTEKLFPIGISSGNEEQKKIALELYIPPHTIRSIHTENRSATQNIANPAKETITEKIDSKVTDKVENKLISHPIRSGQRIYVKGDLTVLSHVSAGAEIMAEGNIHVYGALRGRALAGVQGNTNSRIFCSALQAELVSIAGHYKISEELDSVDQHRPTQVFLQDQALIINNI